MDLDRPTEDADDLCLTEASPHATAAEVLISVCTSCKSADGEAGIGPALFDALNVAISDRTVAVRRVQCLGVCKRPATVAVSSADGYTFLFGDLEIDSGTAALASFVQSYRDAAYGLVPWRERAEVLRKGMIARLPPASWSPDDGRAPT
jgi:predicted metal-binding protein